MIRLAHKHARFATRSVRFGTLTLALLLVFCTLPAWSSSALSQTPSNAPMASNPQYMAFSATGSLANTGSWGLIIPLKDGKVLAFTGLGSSIYDPDTGNLISKQDPPWGHIGGIATVLDSGKVLFSGGGIPHIYDPEADTWSATPNETGVSDREQTATLLKDGRVLVTGGPFNKKTVLYDPSNNTWSLTGSMHDARGYHTATLLNNGKVLVAGGRNSSDGSHKSAELYDPASGTWSLTDHMSTVRAFHTATLLNDGRVLVTGGFDVRQGASTGIFDSAELYDPVTDTWSVTGKMNLVRSDHAATLLSDGRVIVTGGYGNLTYTNTAEVYEPTTGTWRLIGDMMRRRLQHKSILLKNGKILISAGYDADSTSDFSPPPELGMLTDDTDLPTGTIKSINAGALATTSQDVVLTLSAQDATSKVGQISLSNDGQTWEAWQPYTETLEWKLAAGDGQKTVYVRFKDYAGNVSAPVSRSIRLDSAAGSEYGLSINNGALFTNQITVELRLSAPALTPQMMISNDGGFAGATWEPYNSVRSWQITQYGSYVLPRTVYVRFKDASGNVFGPNQDDILLDVNAPTGSVEVLPALKTGEEPTVQLGSETSANYIVFLPFVTDAGACPAAGTVNVNLALSADDDVSGVADMMISNSPSFACAKWEKFSKTKAWKAFGKENAPVYVRFRDNAGNVSSAYNSLSRR
jgi:hypothetical protein